MAVICVIIASFILAGVPTIAQNPTVSEAIIIEARGGDNVTFPCDQVLPTPAPDFPIALYVLQWKRQGTALPLYVIFDSTDPIINPAYERRVSLVEGGASLLMANVTAADAGIYECQLIVLGEESTIGNGTFVNLTILVKRKTHTCAACRWFSRKQKWQFGNLEEGKKANTKCDVVDTGRILSAWRAR